MWQQKPNVLLSILVLIVSFFSILVINRQVEAAWFYPTAIPPETNLDNSFVFNPATENFNLDGHSLCLSGVCHNTWPTGGGSGSSDWQINNTLGDDHNALYYSTSSPGLGYVGIGTNDPATKFHIYDADAGPIITLSGLNTNYRGVTIKNTAGQEQWFYGPNDKNDFVVRRIGSTNNLVVASTTGNIGVGDVSFSNILFTASTTSRVVSILGQNNSPMAGIGVSGSGITYGVYGLTTVGSGIYGFAGSPTGVGVYGVNPTGGYAAKFDGNVSLNGNTNVATGKYLKITTGVGKAPSGDCGASDAGRLYFDSTGGVLYVCFASAWKSIP